MKIHSLTTGLVGYSRKVKEKEDSGSSDSHSNQSRQDQKEGQEEESPSEFSSERFQKALEAFQDENKTQENGLSAFVSGIGPGLKVVLQDGSGNIVKELSGEEFLKLREVSLKAGAEGQVRGKILDQKL